MKIKIEKPKLLIVSFLIMYSISGFQFWERNNAYNKLMKSGIITTATQTCIPINRLIVKYVFEFDKADGTKFIRTTRTVDERDFVPERPKRDIIYLLDKPEKYWELYEYKNFNFGGSAFFFFGPYGLIGSLVCYGFLRVLFIFRFKKNRKEFIKTIRNSRI